MAGHNNVQFKNLTDNSYLKSIQDNKLDIESLFSPFINKTKIKYHVNFTTLVNFKNKLKITSNLLDPMIPIWNINKNIILAGGKMIDFVMNKSLSESTNDYDLYPIYYDMHSLNSSCNNLKLKTTLSYLTEYEDKDNNLYQVMKCSDISEPEDIIESFDFRCSAICTNGKYVWWINGCLHDIRDKKIVMLNPKCILSNGIRLQKYINKGFSISQTDYLLSCIKTVQAMLDYEYTSHEYVKQKFENIIFNRDAIYDRSLIQYDKIDNQANFEQAPIEAIN